jgi:hypothetical protein
MIHASHMRLLHCRYTNRCHCKQLSVTLLDATSATPARGVVVNLFAHSSELLPGPLLIVGDILRLHRCQLQCFNNKPQLVCNRKIKGARSVTFTVTMFGSFSVQLCDCHTHRARSEHARRVHTMSECKRRLMKLRLLCCDTKQQISTTIVLTR